MSRDITEERIGKLARDHGFELCRITKPAIEPRYLECYETWLAAGMQGEMGYMAESTRVERRRRPSTMLDGVRSVICVAMRYSPPPYTLDNANARRRNGVIAAYAHGHDYHDVMKKRLKALARDLDALLGAHDQRVYVDTAPVLEHALAESSGLGWQGKHSLTIHRDFGSWFLLGELFTTADLAADAPASQHCGSCTACLDLCPTRAIVAPYLVDARLCISYLTIEYRGHIPHRLRPMFGNRVYGCDDCQLVCPWNGKAKAPDDDILSPRGENILPDLASLLQLDDTAFRKRFSKSPVKRTGRVAFVRNVCIAAGNSGYADLIPVLESLSDDESPLVRAHAFWALARLAGDDADMRMHLTAIRAGERDHEAREDMSITMEQTRINHE